VLRLSENIMPYAGTGSIGIYGRDAVAFLILFEGLNIVGAVVASLHETP
jgi:hypothetical protein